MFINRDDYTCKPKATEIPVKHWCATEKHWGCYLDATGKHWGCYL